MNEGPRRVDLHELWAERLCLTAGILEFDTERNEPTTGGQSGSPGVTLEPNPTTKTPRLGCHVDGETSYP